MYKQLTREQRYVIYLGLQEKKTYSTIARQISVSISTVSREVKRNSNRHGRYLYKEAHEDTMWRRERTAANRKIKTHVMKEAIKMLVKDQWSPEQIVANLKERNVMISHESIYRYIREHQDLWKYYFNFKYKCNKKD